MKLRNLRKVWFIRVIWSNSSGEDLDWKCETFGLNLKRILVPWMGEETWRILRKKEDLMFTRVRKRNKILNIRNRENFRPSIYASFVDEYNQKMSRSFSIIEF